MSQMTAYLKDNDALHDNSSILGCPETMVPGVQALDWHASALASTRQIRPFFSLREPCITRHVPSKDRFLQSRCKSLHIS